MSEVDKPEVEIEKLSSEDFAEILRRLSEKEGETWDKEIEFYPQAGKLNFLVREAHKEDAEGTKM
jgi:hypothetical protein